MTKCGECDLGYKLMGAGMIINFITSNKNKVLEVQVALGKKFLIRQWDIDCPEIQADNLEDVVLAAARHIIKRYNPDQPFALEDSGLFIDALKGFPGVYSRYVCDTIGCSGILKLMKGINNRKAHFAAVIGYYDPKSGKTVLFKGICHGSIAESKKGSNGFGFDPIFIPEGEKRRFAEMGAEEKGKYSHRGLAIKTLAEYLKYDLRSGAP